MPDPIMPFGKYKGYLISEIPADYLRWCLQSLQRLSPYFRQDIENELNRRNGRSSQQQEAPKSGKNDHKPQLSGWEEVVRTWYRQMAMEFHPDRRLDNGVAMRAINEAHERLKRIVKELENRQ